jgi:chitinase
VISRCGRLRFTAIAATVVLLVAHSDHLAAITVPPPVTQPQPLARWVAGYYVGYQRDLYPEEAIDFSLLTHIIVGRVVPTATGGLVTNFDIDDMNGPAMARRVSARAHAANRPAILMVGGAGARNRFVSAASDANRAAFVSTLLGTMDALGYDGLDIDWEPIRPEDEAQLLALLRALRAARPAMLLTLPVEWRGRSYVAGSSRWLAEAAALVDRINIMSYGMAGRWPGWLSWHSSALAGYTAQHPSSVEVSVRAYIGDGVPAAKLGVGIGFYGTCWRGVTAPGQSIANATVVAADNTMSYTNIMNGYFAAAARLWDERAAAPYLSFQAPTGAAGCTYISYEDAQSIEAKAVFARRQGLGGTIIWTIAQGHDRNAPAERRDALLRVTREAFAK